jgi:hypothetical protein
MTTWRPSKRGSCSTLAMPIELAPHALQQLHAEIGVLHLAATEAQRDLHLVTFFEEAMNGLHLHFVIVVVDVRTNLDLLEFDALGLFARLGLLLLLLEPELAVVEDFADRRIGIGRHLDKVEAGFRAASSAALSGISPCFSPSSSMRSTRATPRISSFTRGPSLLGGGAAYGRLAIGPSPMSVGDKSRAPRL